MAHEFFGYNPILLFILLCKLYPESLLRALSVGSCVRLIDLRHCGFVSTFFFCVPPCFLALQKCSKLILYISSCNPSKQPLLQESWFLLFEDGIRKNDLDTRYVHCYWDDIATIVCQLIELRNIGVYTKPCIKIL